MTEWMEPSVAMTRSERVERREVREAATVGSERGKREVSRKKVEPTTAFRTSGSEEDVSHSERGWTRVNEEVMMESMWREAEVVFRRRSRTHTRTDWSWSRAFTIMDCM